MYQILLYPHQFFKHFSSPNILKFAKILYCIMHATFMFHLSPALQCLSVCEFVRQHLSSGSVCDPGSGKWHSTSDITYIITSDCSSHVKLKLSFMKHFAVVHWDEYK